MYRSPRVSLVGEVAKGREVGCWWLGEGCQDCKLKIYFRYESRQQNLTKA